LRCVAEFFLDVGGGGGLNEFAETGAGVGEAPGGKLDVEEIERFEYDLGGFIVH
jgi:hypothetical protein